MGKGWIVAFVLIILGVGFVGFYSYEPLVFDVPPMYFCESVGDCAIDNTDCTDCSCEGLFGVNKEYVHDICEGVKVETQCDMTCGEISLDCVNNRCVVDLSQ